MRFPSLALLAERATQVLRRFPWTLAAGTLAAAAGIVATTKGAGDVWARLAFVGALGLPVTIALTLLAEVRGWPGSLRMAVLVGSAAALALFFLAWPGIEARHDAMRYFQFDPFRGRPRDAYTVGTLRARAAAHDVSPKSSREYAAQGMLTR